MNEKLTKHWSRQEVASKLAELEAYICLNPETTQSQLAQELGIPRTTLQHWIKRKEEIDADPQIRDFFCSPTGLAFLHRLVIGAQFTLVMLSGGSPRKVAQFLELTGLDRFVASSYGTQRAVSLQIENAIIAFEKQERVRLATDMKKKKITACQDEKFMSDVCLVAIEPSSNFILCEQYADDRKAVTWTKAMKHSLDGLPVEIIQSTSDEAAAIKSHVKKELKAHHSPDLFHVQQEIVKATSLTLARKVKQANQELQKVSRKAQKLKIKLQSEPAQNQAQNQAQKQTATQLPTLLSTQVVAEVSISALAEVPSQLPLQTQLPAQAVADGLRSVPAQAVSDGLIIVPAQIETIEVAQEVIEAGNNIKLDLQAELQKVNTLEKKAALNLQKAEIWQAEAKQVIGKIKQSYHPYDLQTGQARGAKIVKKSIEASFNKLEQIAEEAELSNSSIKRIEKAKRVLTQMVATISFSPKGTRSAVLLDHSG